jgi:hypothetical protein
MSVYTSLTISRRKAAQIVAAAMGDDEELKELVNLVLEKHTLFNVYRLAADGDPNEDERLETSILSLGYGSR